MRWSNADLAIMSMTEEHMDRFLSKVEFSGECWNWKAYRNKKGYGRFRLKGLSVYAHRVACWLRHGAPPEDKPTVDHLCKNTSCVNPDHLRWASCREQITFETHDKVTMDDDTVIDCIKRYLSGEGQRKLSRELGVSPSTINYWVHGQLRPHLLERAKEELNGSY